MTIFLNYGKYRFYYSVLQDCKIILAKHGDYCKAQRVLHFCFFDHLENDYAKELFRGGLQSLVFFFFFAKVCKTCLRHNSITC